MKRTPLTRKTPLKRSGRLKPVSTDEAALKRRYAKFLEGYFADNPLCACGCGQPAEQFHHICRGGNRKASRTNPDTGMGGTEECHGRFDSMTVEEQVAIKIWSIVRRVNEYRSRNLDMAKVLEFLK